MFFDFFTNESDTGQRAELVIEHAAAAPLLSGWMLLAALLVMAALGVLAVRRRPT